MNYVTLTPDTLPEAHICCAISDKKCAKGYADKKDWLAAQYEAGWRFRRLDARGKVFLEYGPAETAFMPIVAPGWLALGCFWVSGQFKGQGHAKALIAHALDEAKAQGRAGLVTVVGRKKMHFLSDGKWLKRQGFIEVDALDNGFSLLARSIDGTQPAEQPRFADSARKGLVPAPKGVTVYYSARCPFTDFHVGTELAETCRKRGLDLTVHKLETLEAAQAAPSPSTVFSLFLDGAFVTTDLSACMDSRFDRVVGAARA